MELNVTPSGSNPTKIVVFDDTMRVAPPKEIPLPSPTRSESYVGGGRCVLESTTFGSDVAANVKQHHNYVENAYPFSWGIEAALHRLQKYIYWNIGLS